VPTGLLVAVEGVDGAGKTSLATKLVETLNRECGGSLALYTREPTSGPIGQLLRSILKGGLNATPSPALLALLFAADRLWHLTVEPLEGCRGILECLARGCIVVSDRYKYSSIAYQSIPLRLNDRLLLGASVEWLWAVNAYAPPAHIIVFLDVDPETASQRLASRSGRAIYEEPAIIEEARRRLARVLAEAVERDDTGSWMGLLERVTGLKPEALYPRGYRPVLLRLDGSSSIRDNVEAVMDAVRSLAPVCQR
jgi:dTMP kinase